MRKEKIGLVISDKVSKTRVVQVNRKAQHELYGKVLKIRKKFYAHDEKNESKVGDTVRILESRPISKLKRWTVVEIVKK